VNLLGVRGSGKARDGRLREVIQVVLYQGHFGFKEVNRVVGGRSLR